MTDPEDARLADLTHRALVDGDESALSELAGVSVASLSGVTHNRGVGASFYLSRTMRKLDIDGAFDDWLTKVEAEKGEPLTLPEIETAKDTFEARRAKLEDEVKLAVASMQRDVDAAAEGGSDPR